MRSVLSFVCVLIAILVSAAFAAATPSSAQAVRIDVETEVLIGADATGVTRHTSRILVRSEAGIRTASHQIVTHQKVVEALEIAEAFTQKPDGRKVLVAQSAISTREVASDPGGGAVRESAATTVAFPDVAVGDTLVLTTVRRQLRPVFPGHFAYNSVFPRNQPWGNVSQTFVAPNGIVLHVAMRGTSVSYASENSGESVRHRFTYAGAAAALAEEPGAVAAIDREPGFSISTFDSYEEFGALYWREAAPRVSASDRIRSLADELTYGLTSKRDEAEAIDRWMKRYVRHVGSEIMRTPWEPASADQILERRSGDCRDLAALASALLEARGIRAEHALINLGTSYELGRYPPGNLNHVILHLPDLGVYSDPSAAFTAFPVLPQELYDKPVLLVSKAGVRQARTPPLAASEHGLVTTSRIAIAADGSVSGSTTQAATGLFATALRTAALRIQASGPEKAAEALLKAQRTPGTGTFEVASPSELREPYTVKSTFTWTEKLAVPLRGNRRTPFGLPVHSRPGTFLLGPRIEARRDPFVCLAGRQVEEIEIEFAPELTLPRRLPVRSIETPLISFSSNNWLEGRTLKIKREFKSTVPGQACEPETAETLAKDMDRVLANVGGMLSFGNQ